MRRTSPTHARSGRPRAGAWWVATALAAAVAAVLVVALLTPTTRSAPSKREPEPTAATRAVVERRALGEEAPTLRGTVRLASRISVPAPAAAPPVERLVVTDAPADVGTVVSSGNVVIGISGRPIIALATEVPLYRPMRAGDTGEDVRQLQAALAELGLYTGDLDGLFGPLTADAVAALYAQAGYETAPPDAQRTAALQQAEDRWASLQAAQDAAEDGVGEPPAADVAQARRALVRARDEAGVWLPPAEIAHVPGEGAMVTSITELGAVLTPDQATVAELVGGTPLLTVSGPAAQRDAFEPGAAVEVRVAGSDDSVPGTIVPTASAVASVPGAGGATADPGGAVAIAAPGAAEAGIEDGARVVVTLMGGRAPAPRLVVPLDAVHEDQDGRYVMAAGEEGARRVAVELGERRDGYVEVLPGALLDEGDEVMVGPATASPGTR